MRLLLLHFGDIDYELAEADQNWRPLRSVPVVWDDKNDHPNVTQTLELLSNSDSLDHSRREGKVVARLGEQDGYAHPAHLLIAADFWAAIITS